MPARSGNASVEATTLGVLGSMLVEEGRTDEALPLLAQAYRRHRDNGDDLEVATDFVRIAEALASLGRFTEAVEFIGLSAPFPEELGMSPPAWVERMAERALVPAREQLGPAEFDEAQERGRRLDPDVAVAAATRKPTG